jgi:hypothetical protein
LRTLIILAALIAGTCGLFSQGLYFESVIKGGPIKGTGHIMKTYLMPKTMKHVNAEDGDFLILRLDKQTITSVDVKEKSYWEKAFAELEQSSKVASAKMDKRMKELKEQMKGMPEEQRKMMEKMVGSQMEISAGNVTLTKTRETKKINGFPCTKYVIKEGTRELMTIWTTKEVKGFEPLRKDYEELSRRMTSMNPQFMRALIDAMLKVEGFPIQTDWGEMSTTVTKVEQRSTPESEFGVPAGYTKKKAPTEEE